jgi:hypothetical protein
VAAEPAPEAVPGWPTVSPRRRSRRSLFLLVLVAFGAAAAIVAYRLSHKVWSGTVPPLQVISVTASSPTTAGCGQTINVTGVISTNGGRGTIAYRWSRSDSVDSGEQLSAVPEQTRYAVVLQWTSQGRGRFDAVATLQVTTPLGSSPAAAHSLYTC